MHINFAVKMPRDGIENRQVAISAQQGAGFLMIGVCYRVRQYFFPWWTAY
jgi:hypothetical protein